MTAKKQDKSVTDTSERAVFIDQSATYLSAHTCDPSIGFHLGGFLELCNLAETLCLADKVYEVSLKLRRSIGENEPLGFFMPRFMARFCVSLMKPEFFAPVTVRALEMPPWIDTAMAQRCRRLLRETRRFEQGEAGYYDFVRYLTAIATTLQEAATGVPYYPSLDLATLYFRAVEPRNSFRINHRLLDVYHQYVSGAQSVSRAQELFTGVRTFFIPPIMAIILSRVSAPQEILEALLELRQELAPLRRRMGEYAEVLREEVLARRSQQRLIAQLERSFQDFLAPYGELGVRDARIQTAGLNGKQVICEMMEAAGMSGSGNWLRFITKNGIKVAELLPRYLSRWRVRELFMLKYKCENIESHARLINKVWGHALTDQQIIVARECAATTERLLRFHIPQR